MITAAPPVALPSPSLWRDVVQPKEHGSWSLALEPIALGLIAAPSPRGAALAVAILAGFLLRRPLKISLRDHSPARRARARNALVVGALAGAGAFVASGAATDLRVAAALLPAVLGGSVFLAFDLRQGGRESVAELAGALAFAVLPGAFVVAAGGSFAAAALLAFVMLARAIPTVLAVRARVRGAKRGQISVAPIWMPAAVAAMAGAALARFGLLPLAVAAALSVLLARAGVYAVLPSAALRARTVGIAELIFGAAYVAIGAIAFYI